MLADVGSILTGFGLAVAVYAALAVYWSIRQDDQRWWESGRNGIIATAALLGAAVLILLLAFLNDDFAIEYVAQHSSRSLPLYLKVSAVWGGQDGSLLLWAFLQALFAALMVARPSEEARPLVPWASVFMSLITAFFVAMTLFLSNPFALSQPVPADGQGLNPLLRHPGMIFHPPALYLGYVGLAVPFAMGLAALVSRKIEGWPTAARPWTLAAWLFLGLGLFLGMRWAYDVLGWGGYWGWDPVENAGLMPWLTATGLVHSLVMQDRRRGFRWWSVILAMLSFVLVLFGTFTTRSGLIQSVHAFARSPLGPYFLAAMGVTLVGSLLLFYNRRRFLSSGESSGALLSREGMFTLTLVLLVTLTVSILIGSVLPTITEALGGGRFEAGPAWFDRVTGPQFAALVLVMGACPLLGQAAGALRQLRRRGIPTLVGGLAVPIVCLLAGFTRPFSLVGFAIVGLAGGTAIAEIARGFSTQMRRGEGPLRAFWLTFSRNRRRYGGYLVHLGIILMAVGVIGTRLYPFETEAVLMPGESIDVQDYKLVFSDLERSAQGNPVTSLASIEVYRGEKALRTLHPSLDQYSDYQQTMAVPAVRTGLREDLYLVLAGWSEGGAQITLKVFINPLASFLWLGGLVFMAGGAVALWPSTRTARLSDDEVRRRRVWGAVGAAVGLILLALAAWAMWGNPRTTAASTGSLGGGTGTAETRFGSGSRPRVGQAAPDISVDLLNGETIRLADLRDEVVVINFWSPDCQPCLDEMPGLQDVWESYRDDGVAFLGISLPELEADVRETISDFGITYPIALNNRAPVEYGITGVPETFLIGPEGEIAYVHIGPLKAERLREEIDSLLAQ